MVEIILLVGLFQIYFLNFKPKNEIIAAAKALGINNLRGFFFGVLSAAEKKPPVFMEDNIDNNYLFKLLKKDWPLDYHKLVLFSLSEQCNSIRVFNDVFYEKNINKIYKDTWIKNDKSIILNSRTNPSKLEGFTDGDYYVQGVSAQILEQYLDLRENQKVLDVCCGAGGKYFLAKDLLPKSCSFTLIDLSKRQIARLKENCERLKFMPDEIICQNFLEHKNAGYDLILLDAPCSASGNIAKHPEIKFRLNATELANLTSLQQQLIEHAWQLLKPGGSMIYMTCSMLKVENELQMKKFFDLHKNAREEGGLTKNIDISDIGHQIMPSQEKSGFYYCKINKL